MCANDSSLRLRLPDGTPLRLRPVAAEDKPRFLEAWRRLSPDSRYLRFFTPLKQLSGERLRFLTEVDQIDHIAWAALDERDLRLPGLGVGRFIRLDDRPQVADFALTVIDEYQGRGLGRLLLAALYLEARAHGVRVLRGEVLWQNHRLRPWLLNLGARLIRESDCDVLHLRISPDLHRLRQSGSGRRLADTIEGLQSALGHV